MKNKILFGIIGIVILTIGILIGSLLILKNDSVMTFNETKEITLGMSKKDVVKYEKNDTTDNIDINDNKVICYYATKYNLPCLLYYKFDNELNLIEITTIFTSMNMDNFEKFKTELKKEYGKPTKEETRTDGSAFSVWEETEIEIGLMLYSNQISIFERVPK